MNKKTTATGDLQPDKSTLLALEELNKYMDGRIKEAYEKGLRDGMLRGIKTLGGFFDVFDNETLVGWVKNTRRNAEDVKDMKNIIESGIF